MRKARDEARRERTRKGLMEAGNNVMAHKGYHRTLISDIVEEAGVGQGTFYRHFNSKRELFQEMFEAFVGDLIGEFDGFSANLPTNEKEYRVASQVAVTEVGRRLHRRRDLARMFLREGPSIDQLFEQTLDEVYDQFAALASAYLEHAIEAGFARPCNANVVAQCLVGMAQRHLLRSLAESLAELDVDAIAQEAITFAFEGIGTGVGQ
jgi:AcrR family transcriptional regulator